MKNDLLISVIIPCYNSEKTIERTLMSLSKQTFQKFEVILIDDGSEDSTISLIKKNHNLNIRVISQEHKGVSNARNTGIAEAKGEYITFLDSDDMYDARFLEILYKSIIKSDRDIVFSRFMFVRGQDIQQYNCNCNKIIAKNLTKYQTFKSITSYRKEKINFWCAIYKKSIIENNRIRFNENISHGEDTQFFLEYCSYCEKGSLLIKEALYKYYVSENSVTQRVSALNIQNIEAHQHGLKKWIENGDITKKDMVKVMSRSVWAVAKEYTLLDDRAFYHLCNNYNIRKYMRVMKYESDDAAVRISAIVFLISPDMFKWIIRFYMNLKCFITSTGRIGT